MEEEEEENPQLELAIKLLSLGDFSTARKYARLSPPNPTRTPLPDQIIAVADVLLASSPDLPNLPTDHYSILQLQPPHSQSPDPAWPTTVRNHFLNLFSLIHPVKDTLPFASQAFHLICQARTLLSNPETRARFDEEIRAPPSGESESETFWTVCPYCFYMYEFDGLYEGCCLMCQNCGKAFHGAALEDHPPEPSWGFGIEVYYRGVGMFPLRCCGGGGGSGGSNTRVRRGSGRNVGGSGYVKSVPRKRRK